MEDNNINMLLDNFLDALSTVGENSSDKSAIELVETFNALPREYQKELLIKIQALIHRQIQRLYLV